MAFGQSAGPPATTKQVKELLDLLQDAGHVDFRDARGPMGFTQRQASGKFTRDEADAFIEQLQLAADQREEGATSDIVAGGDPGPPASTAASAPRRSRAEMALSRYSDAQLAAELQHRGWIVVEP